jgi:hypothetical protein
MANFKYHTVCTKFFFKLVKNSREFSEILKATMAQQMMSFWAVFFFQVKK